MFQRDQLTIRTPDGVQFRFRLAGPVSRFLALCIDLACIFALSSLVSSIAKVVSHLSLDIAIAIAIVSYLLISLLFPMVLEWRWNGQTLGKRVLKIRVIDSEGLNLSPAQVIVRNLLRSVDLLPALYTLGGLVALFSPKLQRLGDIAAGTVVIRTHLEPLPDLDLLLEGMPNSLRNHPRIAGRLRQLVSPEQARLALEAVFRRDGLEPAARLEVFEALAKHFRSLIAFPEESTFGLTDEQYVRDVVDLLFRPRLSSPEIRSVRQEINSRPAAVPPALPNQFR